MHRASKFVGTVVTCCLLAGCGQKLPSEYHGRWSCGVSGTYEISGSAVIGPRGGQRSEIGETKDYNGGKYVGMRDKSALVSLALRRVGNRMSIDGIMCDPR